MVLLYYKVSAAAGALADYTTKKATYDTLLAAWDGTLGTAGVVLAAQAAANAAQAGAFPKADALTFQMGTTSADTIKTASGVQSNIVGLTGMASAQTLVSQWNAGIDAGNSMQSAARSILSNVDDALNKIKWMESRFRFNSKSIRIKY